MTYLQVIPQKSPKTLQVAGYKSEGACPPTPLRWALHPGFQCQRAVNIWCTGRGCDVWRQPGVPTEKN